MESLLPAIAVSRLGRIARTALAALGFLLLLVTLAPPRWYVGLLAGSWNDPSGATLIVLGDDSVDGRILGESSYWRSVYTILAWKEGGFRRVLLSGAASITHSMRDFIVCQGVPAEAVVLEDRSQSTRENAVFTARAVRDIPGPYVLLTSDYHMFRAHRAFRKAGLDTAPRPFPDAGKRFNDWRARWQVVLELGVETAKIAYYRMRGWI